MKGGVILCGLNGSGKSTLGRALALRLDWEFIDIEDCFFPKTDPSYLYAQPRSRQEAAAILRERAASAGSFVLASVKGDYEGPVSYTHLDVYKRQALVCQGWL